jgi:hypothetical protein
MHQLPQILAGANSILLSFVDDVLADEREVIPIDGSSLRFATPAGICVLACAYHQVKSRGQRLHVVGLQPDVESYLDRMDVLSQCDIESTATRMRYPHADSLVELRALDSAREAPDIAHQLAQALTGIVVDGIEDQEDPDGMVAPLSDRVWHPLHYVLSELLENAVTHAKAHGYADSRVWVAANYYRKAGVVRLAVVDNGCGFLTSLERHKAVRDDPTHERAIAAALEPHVSGNPEVGILDSTSNQGIGLTVSRDIARAAKGYVEVTSGNATVRNSRNRVSLRKSEWNRAILDAFMRRQPLLDLNIQTFVEPYYRGPIPELRFE